MFVYVSFHCSIHHNIQVWENCSCLEIENELHTLWDSAKIQILLMTSWWCRVCVCVCVCVRVRVCVCVYTLPPRRPLPSARCLGHTWGAHINDVMLWVSFQVLLPSSSISISENIIFHLQRPNSSTPTNWRETISYIWLWYIRYWYRI